MVDLSELGDVFVILGISQVALFNGTVSLELLVLDTVTGEDFTIPVLPEAIEELSRRRQEAEPEVTPPVEERPALKAVKNEPVAAKRAPSPPDVARPKGRNPVEADQL